MPGPNGGLRALSYVLSGVAVVIISTSIIATAVHVSDGSIHENDEIKKNRIRVVVRDMVEVPPREITQRLDRLESEVREMKAMVRDLLVALVQKNAINHQKKDTGD